MKILRTEEGRGEFFKVLGTTDKSQVATMTLKPGGDSGEGDMHQGDQVVYVIEGRLRAMVSGEEARAKKGDVVIITAGAEHHLYNDGDTDLFVLNFYSSPEY